MHTRDDAAAAGAEATAAGDHLITQILGSVRSGEPGARDRLVDVVYQTLRELAEANRRKLMSHTLDPEALISEAYFRVLGNTGADFENRRHLYGAFSRAMREILIDAARARSALKRGGDRRRVDLDLDLAVIPDDAPTQDVQRLDRLLDLLEADDERAAEVVRYRCFLNMSESAVADVLGVSIRTVQRDWTYARAFMKRQLEQQLDGEP
ncbi:MAG: ECF-type sigma factor [Planctomycetota bacterium]